MDEDCACYMFKQLLAAIQHCHKQQMAYRDVKPANALLTGKWPPLLKLCDFGLVSAKVTKLHAPGTASLIVLVIVLAYGPVLQPRPLVVVVPLFSYHTVQVLA
jgi:serine/threonine protein kinase